MSVRDPMFDFSHYAEGKALRFGAVSDPLPRNWKAGLWRVVNKLGIALGFLAAYALLTGIVWSLSWPT